MKQIGLKKIVIGGVALLALSFVINVNAEIKQATATVRRITGTAQVSKDGGWAALKVNDKIGQGATIRTGHDSTVDLFINNSVVRITQDTTLGLAKILADNSAIGEKVTQTSLSLKEGRILGNVKKLAAASRYEIKTPTGAAAVRGTDFDITVTPLGGDKYKFIVTSIQGTIVGSAVNQQGELKTAVVNTGETWDPDGVGTPVTLPPDVFAALQAEIKRITTTIVVDGKPATTPTPEPQEFVSPTTGQ